MKQENFFLSFEKTDDRSSQMKHNLLFVVERIQQIEVVLIKSN